jgi:hypothetical protein
LDDAGMAAGAFSLRRAPLTVTLSFLALFGWIASFCAMHYLGQFGRAVLPEWLFGGVVFAGSIAVAVPLASLATRPLEGIFKTNEGRRRGDLVGSVCRIRTGRVDDGFAETACGVGACQRTAPLCVAGRFVACAPGAPAAERCVSREPSSSRAALAAGAPSAAAEPPSA